MWIALLSKFQSGVQGFNNEDFYLEKVRKFSAISFDCF